MKQKVDIKTIEFDLIENGLDFILSSLDPIIEYRDETLLKYSILHLSAGTELILKERLRREHWTLIFSNVKYANLNNLKTGDFQSVNFESLIERLENICEIEFDEAELKYLRDLKKRRNRIEHFEFKELDVAIKSLTSKVLSFIFSFINKEFEFGTLSTHSRHQIGILRKKIGEFDEFTELRLNQISDKLKSKREVTEVLTCSTCFQDTFVLNEELECLFCGYSDDAESAALNFIENVLGINAYLEIKDGGYFPLESCFECGEDTLVDTREDFICFNCSSRWLRADVIECSGCGELFLRNEDTFIDVCEACLNYRIERFG